PRPALPSFPTRRSSDLLVLHLRRQRELALERRSAEDPLALGQDAHELGVAVHLDELDQLRPVVLRHPVGRLDLAAALDVLEKCLDRKSTRLNSSHRTIS